MSTFYDAIVIFRRKEDGEISTIPFTFDKNILIGYELPNEVCTEVNPVVANELSKVFINKVSYVSKTFLGYASEKDVEGMNIEEVPSNIHWMPKGAKRMVTVLKGTTKFENLYPDNNEHHDIAIVECVTKIPDLSRVWTFEPGAWDEFIEISKKGYDEVFRKRTEFEFLKKTLEYQKLNAKEKANIYAEYCDAYDQYPSRYVPGEFESIPDQPSIEYYLENYNYAMFLEQLMRTSPYVDYDVICFVYNSDNFVEDINDAK